MANGNGTEPPPSSLPAPVPRAQQALDTFVTTQLIDNSMDMIARRINHLYDKIQKAELPDSDVSDHTKRKWAQRLQHLLLTGCHVLQQQRQQLGDCIDTIEHELKEGAIGTGQGQAVSQGSIHGRTLTPDDSEVLVQCHEAKLPVGCHVAARVTRSHELWILARVTSFEEANNTYSVEDVDQGENETARTHHFVPRHHIVQLPAEFLSQGSWIQYATNQRVLAMYPNTTSFYRAQVRVPNPKGAPYVILKFDDDGEEVGGAPDVKVPFRFVAPSPADHHIKR
ncbi:TPA: hypothetical protein N0F65_004063 [Lagenidium giganteum]|uniref:SGF29 C-terminal domain-containing protein n=1 Tax=Lagenidium giganteum TaxID=4803 RepID=A0AAV2YZD3_9STRA|nr:TPA: hypothetical protein N0F65_004063 [Lagenidium giganteum]